MSTQQRESHPWLKEQKVLPFNRESYDGQNGRIGHGLSSQHLSIADSFSKYPWILTPKPVELERHGWNKEKVSEVTNNTHVPRETYSRNAALSYIIAKRAAPFISFPRVFSEVNATFDHEKCISSRSTPIMCKMSQHRSFLMEILLALQKNAFFL